MSAASLEFLHDAVVQQLGLHIESTAFLDYCRFSESPLWALQRQYYARQGVNAARRSRRAAHHAETPLLADSYADVIVAYWEDALLTGQLDDGEPVYLLELGAGSGVFTHLLLKAIETKIAHSALHELRWVILAADMVQTNLDHIRRHPHLQPWFDTGRLDTICLDVEAAGTGGISAGGISLSCLANPLVAVANGLFGTLTQDLLHVHYGKVLEARVALGRCLLPETDEAPHDEFSRKLHRLDNPFGDIELNYTWVAADDPQWLHPECRRLLPGYVERLDSCSLLVPTGALNCLRYLLDISAGRCLLLGLDYGHVREQDLRMQSAPQLFAHGDFTLPVNHHLIQRHARELGALTWASQPRDNNGLVNMALLFATETRAFGNTETRVVTRLLDTAQEDYLYLRNALAASPPMALPPQALLSLVKTAHCDPLLLAALYPALRDAFAQIGTHERRHWCEVLARALDLYLPDGADSTELFRLGLLALDLNDWGLALDVFTLLHDRHPADAAVVHNLAIATLHTGSTTTALRMLELAIADTVEVDAAVLEAAQAVERRCATTPWYVPAVAEHGTLLLRPLCAIDAPAFYHQYRDPAIAMLARLQNFDGVDAVAQWIEEEAAHVDKATYGAFHRRHGFVGIVSFRFDAGKGYFHFWIGTDYQNAGLGQQAALLACQQARAMGLHTFYTSVYRDNRRSIHALERCGFALLPLAAEEPDEDLLFYRHALAPQNHADAPATETIRKELTQFLRAIDSPIQLKPTQMSAMVSTNPYER
jgi:RimJ/RimL family protein N-acetyltransferase